jgi:hypothetical protein
MTGKLPQTDTAITICDEENVKKARENPGSAGALDVATADRRPERCLDRAGNQAKVAPADGCEACLSPSFRS